MDIDWTKDVEGEFGDTRRRLYPLKNDLGDVVAVDDLTRVWRLDSPDCPRVRNVAPKPVRHEVWVNLYRDGSARTAGRTEKDAIHVNAQMYGHMQDDGCIDRRRIVWHSDGSPVLDEDQQKIVLLLSSKTVEVESLKQERDELKAECEQWKEKAEKALDLLTRVNDEREQLVDEILRSLRWI